jgi:ABC-type branched-subunit amino acid transport system substrate-binding protein
MKAKVFGAVLAVGMMVYCAVTSQEVAPIKVVKIGHVAPLTGALGNLGKDNERGFLGPDGISTNEFARMVGDAYLDGQVICFETGGAQSDRVPAMAEWSQRFRARFNAPVQLYAPYVYDATMVMAAAVQKANSTDPT